MASNRILMFGDTADAPVALIRQLLAKSRCSKNTQLFIQNAVEAVGREIQTLPPPQRNSVGVIHNIQDLQECYECKRDHFGIARTVLLFVARVGELILHAEKDPLLLIGNDNSSPVIALSISSSMLAAAAAAVANDVGELIEVATFLAVVTCRQAVQIRLRGIQIENNNGDWAFSALGEFVTDLPLVLDNFHKDQAIPQHREAYIGIQATSWATVFGPPSVLKKLVGSSKVLQSSHVVPLPAFGPVHAAHLGSPNFEYMIGETHLLEKSIKSNYKLISGSTYRPLVGPSLRNLLRHCLEDIFQHFTNPEHVFEAGISLLNTQQETSLFTLGNTSYLPSFKRMLQRKRLKVAVKTQISTQEIFGGRVGSDSIAIVGMSGRFPGSDTVEELWTSIMERKEFHTKIPADRFDVESYFDEEGRAKNSITTPYGCFLEHPGFFDHKLFNVSPREAFQMDPAQRLLMHTTYEALEDAGMTTNGSRTTDGKRISTFIGLGSDDWKEVLESLGVDIHWIQGTQRAFAPGRLSHHFKWEGATTCVDSACASAATAVGLAFKALISRDCDTAIAGGANIITTPFAHSALSRGGFLSSTGGCKTFREDADGYCRGEAVGVLVLKRLEDALQDNDNIVSVIRGYARNHSAEATSITHPHVRTQERLYRSILHKTGLEPHDIDYVEMHGTGTIAGDSTELESVANVLAKAGSRQRQLVVGAIKANVGHSEAAAGILSIMKGAMVLQKETIPAQAGILGKLAHYPCLENSQILVPGNSMPFPSVGQGKKRILVNNFDAAGGNSCFILEEPPKRQAEDLDPRAFHVVTLSAHSTASFDQNKRRMLQFLTGNRNISLANLAYTITARRNHHLLRAAYCGASTGGIAEALRSDLNGVAGVGQQLRNAQNTTPVVFVFGGQGGLYAGMGKDLFKTSNQFRGIIAELESICGSLGFPSFTNLIADQDTRMESMNIVQLHLSLVALEIALTKLWETWGVKPDMVMGHSLGEYPALCAAGVLSIFDAMYLVGKRAQLLESKCVAGTHAMLSISGTVNEVSLLVSEENLKGCEVSCFNGPGMVVLSGEQQQILILEMLLKKRGLKCQLLDIPYGMHSCQMDAISLEFGDILDSVLFCKPKIKIISTLLGHQIMEASSFGRDYLIRQTREPVRFQQAVASCISQGFADASSLWLEIGPNASCLALVRANINVTSSNTLASLKRAENNWRTVSVSLATLYMAKQPIHWRAFHNDFTDNLSHIDLLKYAFDTRDFWITYKSNDQQSQANGLVTEKDAEPEPISTCLHHLAKRVDDEYQQSASFISKIPHTSLTQIVEGHKLCGITVCSAGVFIDMALTAARHIITGGNFAVPWPALLVCDLRVDRALVPTTESQKAIRIDVTGKMYPGAEFSVSFSDDSGTSPSAFANCLVCPRDQSVFDAETQKLSFSSQLKIAKLMEASEGGLADRIRGKVFYKLFSNLMEYSDIFKGVESVVVSDDFRELTAIIRLPAHDARRLDQRFTLSPYWSDILGQTLGFLLNGNPNQADGYVYITTHIEHLDLQARDFSPDVCYQVHAYINHSDESSYRGNAYIIRENIVVGLLEGLRFQKMPRKTLLHSLGKVAAPQLKNLVQSKTSRSLVESNISSAGPSALEGGYKANGHNVSLATTFRRILLDETRLLESELVPSASFSELGVDSIFSISILAALKAETGTELGTSFLTESPTLEDAERALRIMENQNSTLAKSKALKNEQMNGHTDGDEAPNTTRESNVVLMSGSTHTPSPTSLFMITDGAGSAAAYVHLPRFADDLQVFALESPWVKDPKNFTCTFSEAVEIYLAAIRAKQPRGPYLLGGWSGGSVFAYEVSRLLLEAGEKVIGLIIIDMLAPRHVNRSKVAMPTFAIIEHMGMLNGIDRTVSDISALSLQMKEHMLSTIRCFSQLDPTPMASGYRPDATFVIWATDLTRPEPINDGSTELRGQNLEAWFYPSQHDFGPNGWDLLVGDKVECFQTQGDHFSIMNMPHVKQLGQILQQQIFRCLDSVGHPQEIS